MHNLFKLYLSIVTAIFMSASLTACDSSEDDPFADSSGGGNGNGGGTSAYDGICVDADNNIWSHTLDYGWPTEDNCADQYLDMDPADYTEQGAYVGSCDDRDGKVWFYYEYSGSAQGDNGMAELMCEEMGDIWTPAP